jgi:hypothetical protein
MDVHRRPVPRGATSHGAVDRRSMPAGLDPRMHDALTDLHTYALALDAERERLSDRVAQLISQGALLDDRRAAISEELEALRATVIALRACADPAGTRL